MRFLPKTSFVRSTDSPKISTTPMYFPYFSRIYIDVHSKIMDSTDSSVAWKDNVGGVVESFVGKLQIYKDMTAMTLKINALVA